MIKNKNETLDSRRIIKVVKCSECAKSAMNGRHFICTKYEEIIKIDDQLCSVFEPKDCTDD